MGRHLKKPITKIIALPDCHIPHNIDLGAVREFIKDFQPDIIVLLGDFLNLDPVSHWIIDKKRLIEGKRLKEEYQMGNHEIELIKEAAPKSKIVYITGNHEDWVEQYIDKHPEMEGLIEVRDHIKGVDKWIDFNRLFKVGKLHYIHGVYTNEFHSKKTVMNYLVNVIYGHDHGMQSYGMVAQQDQHGFMGKSVGCLCKDDMPFMKHKPNKWFKGFNYAYVRPDGNFNDYTVVITNGTFTAEGKTYQ